MIKKVIVLGVALATATLAAGCKSSSGNGAAPGAMIGPAASASPSPASAATTAPPAPKATVTVTATATTTVAPGLPKPCTGPQVVVTLGTGDGAAGTLVQRFIVKNKSGVTCTMDKYPFISPYGLVKQGSTKVEANLVDVTVEPIPSTFGVLGAAGGVQTLHPGDTAVFFLKWSQVPVDDNPCVQADGFDFKPPSNGIDDNELVAFKFTPCGNDLQVSQVMSPSVAG